MDDLPVKAIWIVGGVVLALGLIALLSPWATSYISGILPG